jgi:hypothetical protein
VLQIVLHDGREITAEATSDQRTARPETLAAIRQAAERHAVRPYSPARPIP